jgi:hypothetical protein
MARATKKERREIYAAARYYGLTRAEAKRLGSIKQLNKRLGRPILPTRTESYTVAAPTMRMLHNPYHYVFRVTIERSGHRRVQHLTVVSSLPMTRAEMETRLHEKFRQMRDNRESGIDDDDTIFSYHFREAVKYE